MTNQELIARITDDEVEVQTVFDEMLEHFKEHDPKYLLGFLLACRKIDVDKHYDRMAEIGELGAQSETYHQYMITMFNYAEKQGVDLRMNSDEAEG